MIYYYLYIGKCPIKIFTTKTGALEHALRIHKTQGFKNFEIYTYSEREVELLDVDKIYIIDSEVYFL